MIRMKTLAAVLACSLIGGGVHALQIGARSSAAQTSTPQTKGATEKPAKAFAIGDEVDAAIALRDIAGKVHTLKDYRGKIVVLDFWSIKCPWSIGYENRFKAFYKEYQGKDLVFLAIDSNHTEVDAATADPFGRIKKYVKENEIPFPILIDEGNAVADRFDARTTPHVFVIDAKGKLAYRGAMDDDPKNERGQDATHHVANVVRELRAGEKVSVPETRPKGCGIKRVRAERADTTKKKRAGI